MRTFFVALMFGALFTVVGYAQDKTDKSCCSSENSETTMNKIFDVPKEASLSSSEKDDLAVSVQSNDKNKKVEKKMRKVEKNMKEDNSKKNSSEDGCCTPSNKKTEKIKTSHKF